MSIHLPANAFQEVFPFHVAFGADWRILENGPSLSRLCPAIRAGGLFNELFAPCRPERPFVFHEMVAARRTLFLIRERASDLLLRGQMFPLVLDGEVVVFLGSPWFTDTADITRRGLSFDDFAIHDPAVDLLQVLQSQRMALEDLQALTHTLKDQRTALREANAQLKREKEESRKLALVAARTDNAVVLTDAQGHTEWVNEGFTRLTGYTLDDMRGRSPGSVLQGPDTDPKTVAYMRDRIREGKGFSAEIVNYGKSGCKYWLAIEVQPIFDDEGRITNFMAIESDVTERRASQQRLAIQYDVSRVLGLAERMSEAIPGLLKAICENLGWQVGAVWQVHGGVLKLADLWVSASIHVPGFLAASQGQSFARGIGLPGRVWKRAEPVWIPDVTGDDNFPRRQAAAAGGLHAAFAFPIFVHGEVWGVVEFFSRRIEEPDQELLKGFKSVGSQIGQYIVLREAQDALRAASTLQQAILESANYAIVSTTKEGIVSTFNAAAERMLGRSSREVVGKATPALWHDGEEVAARAAQLTQELGREIQPGFEAFVARAALGETDEREWTYIRKDGRRIPVLLSVTALFDGHGGVTGYLGVASDVTEEKRSQEILLRAKEAAEDANRAKSEFLAVMSHEIRTPMNGILGMANLLEETPLDGHQRELVQTVQQSGEALLEIINDILDFSKMESRGLALEVEDLEVSGLVEGVVSLLSPRAAEKDITLTAIVDPQIPPLLRGDDGRLRQILLNLIGNGIKFTDVGDVVLRVRCVQKNPHKARVHFAVVDSGIGIDADQQRRLFQPFTQLDLSSQRRYGGTGLGLAICKRLVELMGGIIGLESQPGKGSVFWFELEFDMPQTDVRSVFSDALCGWNVILVSSHRPTVEAMTAMLGTAGAALETLPDSASAGKRLCRSQQEPTLVVVDSLIGGEGTRNITAWLRSAAARANTRSLILLPPRQVAGGPQVPEHEGFDRHVFRPIRVSDVLACCVVLAKGDRASEAGALALPGGTAEMFSRYEAPKGPDEPLRILVAEDHDTNRRLAMFMLERLGYKADYVFDGREAVDAVKRVSYDVVLMDCQMPLMDGYEATRTIRKIEEEQGSEQSRRIHIIAMTANAMRGDREKCLEAGMDGYISKPISMNALGRALAALRPGLNVGRQAASPPPLEGMRVALRNLEEEFGPEPVTELLASFIRDTPSRLAELRSQVAAEDDREGVARNAHALAGSAGIFGLEIFRERALDVERAAKAEAWDRCTTSLQALRNSYPSVENHLREYLATLEAGTEQRRRQA